MAEDNLASEGDGHGTVSVESVEKAGAIGSEVPWKEWNWLSKRLDARVEEKQVRFCAVLWLKDKPPVLY